MKNYENITAQEAERLESKARNANSTMLTMVGTFCVVGLVYFVSSFVFDEETMKSIGRAAPRVAMWIMVGLAAVGVLFGIVAAVITKSRRPNLLVLGFGSALFAATIAGGLWVITGPLHETEQEILATIAARD